MEKETLNRNAEELIVRYLAGEADNEEQLLLLQWLKEDPEHVREFNSMRKVSDYCKQIQLQEDAFHLEKAITTFDSRREAIACTTNSFKRPTFKRIVWVISSVAAVAVLFLFISLARTKHNSASLLVAQATDKPVSVELSDGTKAFLSKNTRIFAPETFNKQHRILSLQGEAYFQVKHDKAHPFVIKANNATITDIGTAFTVNTDSVSRNSFISVKEGVVKVDYFGYKSLLHAGDFAKTNAKTKQLIIGKSDKKAEVDANGTLVFDNTPMSQVVVKINERYHTHFELASPSLQKCKLNASFDKNTNVEQIKELLSIVLNVTIKDTGGKLLIYTHSD